MTEPRSSYHNTENCDFTQIINPFQIVTVLEVRKSKKKLPSKLPETILLLQHYQEQQLFLR